MKTMKKIPNGFWETTQYFFVVASKSAIHAIESTFPMHFTVDWFHSFVCAFFFFFFCLPSIWLISNHIIYNISLFHSLSPSLSICIFRIYFDFVSVSFFFLSSMIILTVCWWCSSFLMVLCFHFLFFSFLWLYGTRQR